MKLTQEQQAALPTLLAEITGMAQVVGALEGLAADGTAAITGSVSVSSEATGNTSLSLPAMTPEESAPFFAAALSVFQARLKALQDQLTAL